MTDRETEDGFPLEAGAVRGCRLVSFLAMGLCPPFGAISLQSGGGDWQDWLGLAVAFARGLPRFQDLRTDSGWWSLRDWSPSGAVAGTCGVRLDGSPENRPCCAGVVWVGRFWSGKCCRGRSHSIEVEIVCELFVSSHQGHSWKTKEVQVAVSVVLVRDELVFHLPQPPGTLGVTFHELCGCWWAHSQTVVSV